MRLGETKVISLAVGERWFGGCSGGRHGRICCSWCCFSVPHSCLPLFNSMKYSTPGFPVLQHLSELTQTHVHWVSDAIQPSHPLSPSSLPALNLSQHQGHFHWVDSSHQVAKVLKLQLQQQSFRWIFRVDFLRIDCFGLQCMFLYFYFLWLSPFSGFKFVHTSLCSGLVGNAAVLRGSLTCPSFTYGSRPSSVW